MSLHQNVPDDVVGQFLRDAFLGNRLPGDQGSNLQFVLSMLSPGAVQSRRELLSPAAEAANRIPVEDIQQSLTSALGLTTSPVEKFNTALNLLQQFDVSPEQAREVVGSLAPQEPRQAARVSAGAAPPRQAPTERLETREQQALDVKTQKDFNTQRRLILSDIMTQARVNSDARRLLVLSRQDPEVTKMLEILAGLGSLAGDDALERGGKDLVGVIINRLSTKLGIPEEELIDTNRGIFGRWWNRTFGPDKTTAGEPGAEAGAADPLAPSQKPVEDMDDNELLEFLLAK